MSWLLLRLVISMHGLNMKYHLLLDYGYFKLRVIRFFFTEHTKNRGHDLYKPS